MFLWNPLKSSMVLPCPSHTLRLKSLCGDLAIRMVAMGPVIWVAKKMKWCNVLFEMSRDQKILHLKKNNISIDVNHPDVISSLNHKQLSNHPAADSVLGCPTDQLEYVTSLFLTGDASQLLQAIASGSNIAPIPWTYIPSGKHTKD